MEISASARRENVAQHLEQLAHWPVDHASALVLRRDGQQVVPVARYGELERVYDVASITKLVVAYCVMVAVEEGALDLAEAAGPPDATVRHLLAHASGMHFDQPTAQRPVGQRRIYSSAAYEQLAALLARRTGMSFEQYLSEGVLAPLAMTATDLPGGADAAGHGLRTSVRDLAAFATEILNPQLLHPATVGEMLSVHYPQLRGIVPGYGPFNPCDWGLGFEIHGNKHEHWMGSELPATAAGHFGMAGTFFWVSDPWAVIVFTDRQFGSWAKPLWADFNDQLWRHLKDAANS